jgi:hypothetical protein
MWDSLRGPRSSRWLDLEAMAEVFARASFGQSEDGALSWAAQLQSALPRPHLCSRER